MEDEEWIFSATQTQDLQPQTMQQEPESITQPPQETTSPLPSKELKPPKPPHKYSAPAATWVTEAERASRGPTHFEQLSTQLYCAGAMEQLCRVDGRAVWPGHCHWLRSPDWLPTTERDMRRETRARWPNDRFNPRGRGVAGGYRYFGPEAAAACARGHRILVAGDSTTRDTFYELMAVLGNPIRFDGRG